MRVNNWYIQERVIQFMFKRWSVNLELPGAKRSLDKNLAVDLIQTFVCIKVLLKVYVINNLWYKLLLIFMIECYV